jgi:transposase-like protein
MTRRHFKVKNKLQAIKSWRNNGMNLRQTAKRLGLDRKTLRRWIQQESELRRSNHPAFREHVQRE